MKKEPKLVVRGRCHPPPEKSMDYVGWAFREDEVDRYVVQYKNKPVFVEHDPTKQVGVVDKIFKDSKGALVVDLKLFNDERGVDTMRRVREGELGGLSIGFSATSNSMKQRTSHPYPREISIVGVGAMKDTRIFACLINDTVSYLPQHTVYIENSARRTKMTSTSEIIQDEMPAPVAEVASTASVGFDAPPERVQQALRELAEKERRQEAELDALVRGPLAEGWTQCVDLGIINHSTSFANVIGGLVDQNQHEFLEIVANSLTAAAKNFNSLEEERKVAETQQRRAENKAKSATALATPEERKQPTAVANRYAGVFTYKEPADVVAEVAQPEMVHVSNSAGVKRPPAASIYASLFENKGEKRTRVESDLAMELRKAAAPVAVLPPSAPI